MSGRIEGTSGSEAESTNALGVKQTANDYTPGEDETAEETTKNVLALLEAEQNSDGQENESEEQTEPVEEEASGQVEEETETPPAQETPAQAAQRQRDENGRFVKSQQQEQQAKPGTPEVPTFITDPKHRKAFMNMPEGLRNTFHEMVKGQQAHFTRKTQEAAGIINQAKTIVDSATHYINTNNLADNAGQRYTPERLFGELLQAHNNIQTNPDYYLAGLIRDTGASVENINAYLQGENPSGVNISADPTIRALQNEIKSLKGIVEQSAQASREAQSAPAAAEFAAVMREVDPTTGELKYPELQNDDFLESTKPIVAALLRTNASMSPGEAMKRAVTTLTGKTYSQNGNQPILPARQSNLERARSAAVSVRGAIAPTGAQQNLSMDQLEGKDIPDSIEETVRMAMRQLGAA